MPVRFIEHGCGCGVYGCRDSSREVEAVCSTCFHTVRLPVPNPRATLAGQRARLRRRGWATRRPASWIHGVRGRLEDLCPTCAARDMTRRVLAASPRSALVTSPTLPMTMTTRPRINPPGSMRNPFLRSDVAARVTTYTLPFYGSLITFTSDP